MSGLLATLLLASHPAAAQAVNPGAPAPAASGAPAVQAAAPAQAAPEAPSAQPAAAPAQAPAIAPTPAPAAAPAQAPAPAQAAPKEESKPSPTLRVGAGLIFWYYQPFLSAYKNNLQLAYVAIKLRGTYGRFGLYVHPRFRDKKLNAFFDGTAWLEEAYAWADLLPDPTALTLKAGKIYVQLGLPWDNSFYGNIQMFDALKLAPEQGLSLEGGIGAKDAKAGARYALQFFPVDGRTNFAAPNRDVVWIEGARRRYQTLLRAEPFVKLSETALLKGGLTAEYLQADLPEGPQNVGRGAVDAKLTIGTPYGSWGLWGEFLAQLGKSVTDFPYAAKAATETSPAVPGRASAHNYYVLAGTEYSWRFITARYNFSLGRYSDQSVSEWIHEPGLGFSLHDNLTLLTEFVLWQRKAPEGSSIIDRALAISLWGSFSHLVVGKE